MPIYNSGFYRRPPEPLAAILTQIGPVSPVEIHVPQQLAQLLQSAGQPVPPAETGFVLIDTGASKSCVDTAVITALGVNPVGRGNLGTAAGQVPTSLYPARFIIAAGTPAPIHINFSSVVGVDLTGHSVGSQRLIGLIGRDILSRAIFIYNGPMSSFSLAI